MIIDADQNAALNGSGVNTGFNADSGNSGLGSLVTWSALELRLAWGISFGIPIDIDSLGNQTTQHVSEVRGSWVTVSLTNFSGNVTLTHNLNIPVSTVTGGGGTANLPNCRWFTFGMEYGDRTGATAAPAAPGGFTVNFMKMVNGTVTPDAITLAYSVTGFVPDATHPLSVTFFVVAAPV